MCLKEAVVAYGLLLLITVAVYGNTFRNDWTYDDYPVVVQNPASHSMAGFLQRGAVARPMRELTHIPEYMLFGDRPAGYRIQQLFWHGTNGFLLFLFMRRLGVGMVAAGLGTALFLVHPLQTESVASIGHRKELLALFFMMGTVLLYLKGVAAAGRRRFALAVLTLLSFAGALLSNETVVTLPLVLCLLDILIVPPRERLLMKKPVVTGLFFAVAAAGFVYRYRGLFSSEQLLLIYSQNSFFESKGYFPLLGASLKAFAFYLKNVVFPFSLAPEYVVRFPATATDAMVWTGLLLVIGCIATMAATWKRLPVCAFGVGWFLVFYLPVSNLVPAGYIMADRYMYLCLPGVALAVAAGIQRCRGSLAPAVAAMVAVVLALFTIVQNTYWRDSVTLWGHAAKVNPDSTGANMAAASVYLNAGDLKKARAHAERARKLNRFLMPPYLLLGQIAEQEGDIHEAIKNYEFFLTYGGASFPQESRYVSSLLPRLYERARNP